MSAVGQRVVVDGDRPWLAVIQDSELAQDMDGTWTWYFLVVAEANGRYYSVPSWKCGRALDQTPSGESYR